MESPSTNGILATKQIAQLCTPPWDFILMGGSVLGSLYDHHVVHATKVSLLKLKPFEGFANPP